MYIWIQLFYCDISVVLIRELSIVYPLRFVIKLQDPAAVCRSDLHCIEDDTPDVEPTAAEPLVSFYIDIYIS